MTKKMRNERGMTLTEMMTASFLTLVGCIVLAETMRFGRVQWSRGTADEEARRTLTMASARIAPDVREALRIAPSSNERILTVVLPKLGPDGRYVVPLQEGNHVSFYLSDQAGGIPHGLAVSPTRTVLWRAVNGIPDKSWALRGGRAIVQLDKGGLGFGFEAFWASSVTVSLTTLVPPQSYAKPAQVATRLVLRNHRYQ